MSNIFVIATVISFTFLLAKFMEMRYIEKESKPLKFLIRDSLVVYVSVVFGNFIIEQLHSMANNSGGGKKITPVFTDNPNF